MKFTLAQRTFGSLVIEPKEAQSFDIAPSKNIKFELNIGTPGPSAIADLGPIQDSLDSLDERLTATEADVEAHATAIAAHDLRLVALETAEPPVSDFSAPYYASTAQQLSKNDLAVIDKPNTVLVMPPSPEAGDKVGVYALDATGQIQSITLNGQTGNFEIDETQILCVFRFVDSSIGWILC